MGFIRRLRSPAVQSIYPSSLLESPLDAVGKLRNEPPEKHQIDSTERTPKLEQGQTDFGRRPFGREKIFTHRRISFFSDVHKFTHLKHRRKERLGRQSKRLL